MSGKTLNGIRVLEIGSERCAFCGKLMADMGAEVIKIEPSEGDSSRRVGPFYKDQIDRENSLFHAFFNAGKKSIVFDIKNPKNRKQMASLIQSADVLIEAEEPGELDKYYIGYESLIRINPRLVMCSITPYGQRGPWMEWKAASDMIIYAASGAMYELGDEDKAPIQLGYHFLTNGANLYALTGIMAALAAREETGQGDHIDVSLFEVAAAWRGSELGFTQQAPDYRVCQRKGSQGIMVPANFYECKDGYAFIMASGKWSEMIHWMQEIGMDIRGKDDPKYLPNQGFNQFLWEEIDEINGMVNELTLHYTMRELVKEGQKRKIPVGPAETMETVLKNVQYHAREYFREIDSPVLGSARYPAKAFGFSACTMCTECPAPLLGADTEEVLKSLSDKSEKNEALWSMKYSEENHRKNRKKGPLEGILVLDMGWVVAGPHCGRILKDLGATVIRIESASRLDPMRIDARRYGVTEQGSLEEGGWCFQDNNRNKMDLGINLKTKKGRQIFEELVKKADIITSNFAPRGFHHMGLDFETLSKLKKDIIILNASGLGDWGPYSSYMTFAPVLSCYTGITSLIGYEGHGPYGYPGPLADYMGGASMAASVLAALYYRNRSGQGQFIDLSQAEVSIQNLGPQLLDWQLNGRLPKMYGNHHTYGQMVPHNCYECRTDNTWAVLAVQTDEEWGVLAREFWKDFPRLQDKRFQTLEGRLCYQDEIDAIISELFRAFEAEEIAERLQYLGISASKVHSTWDTLYDNVQIKALDYFKIISFPQSHLKPENLLLTGPLIGVASMEPASEYEAGPAFGRDNDFIIKKLLGHDEDFYQSCIAEKVFT